MPKIDMNDVFQTLFAIAWADGDLREAERRFLATLVQRSDEADGVSGWFDHPPAEPDWSGLRADDDAPAAIVRHAAYMAAADDVVQYEETALLERLCAQLGISDQKLHTILEDVEKQRR